MANFYQVNGRIAGFIASKLKIIGYKHIHRVMLDSNDRMFILMKNGTKKEIKIVDYDE